ncbi:MAG: hypothetical protein HFI37_07675 [Lachnospiraceae bacterium]|nr:hypothetical protein [Lachnospiraceae bacterium]
MKSEEKKRICNCCGKILEQEEYVRIEQRWGYFSGKDGILQRGNICEECFDRIVKQFQVPLEEEEITELL